LVDKTLKLLITFTIVGPELSRTGPWSYCATTCAIRGWASAVVKSLRDELIRCKAPRVIMVIFLIKLTSLLHPLANFSYNTNPNYEIPAA
jgi:hypothetical protein